MAGAIGNTPNLQPHEWYAIRSGDNGPWCLCAVDQAAMHPSGGPLRVRVLAMDMSVVDVTDEVRRIAEQQRGRGTTLAFQVAEEQRRAAGDRSRAFPWPRIPGREG